MVLVTVKSALVDPNSDFEIISDDLNFSISFKTPSIEEIPEDPEPESEEESTEEEEETETEASTDDDFEAFAGVSMEE